MRGSYLLITRVKKDTKIKIGKLGRIKFLKGHYIYVGSAIGKKINIENRIKRHLNRKKKKKWHIDYLLENSNTLIDSIVIFPSKRKMECEISKAIEKNADFSIEKFGCSDCKCKSHLHHFKNKKEIMEVLRKIKV